ncbi:MAG: Ig domain protein group 1 domain protein [Candidatus Shapirobacteria bacterium GW2011_GWE1_38_92]|uniref:Ig domain protein group 1 domain protein n=1 Tax=Candidatus Shapirobacteria bacterium GW2011_GWE1_38_92 TaxID=1618489 RepID=A0A0G0NUH7_9BACT|nr:MAG: Ig domain protein group 1 domain protein [Candidatus Shapirobacteria bacterium GW2011_GWE1_38_92]
MPVPYVPQSCPPLPLNFQSYIINSLTRAKYLTIIFFLLLSLFASVFYGKAASGNSASVALENSYLFASPLTAAADGQQLIRITAFILDGRGVGIPNQTVTLNSHPQLTIKNTQSVTDDSGKAVFDISSTTANLYPITAQVGNQPLPQKIKINFH